VRGGGAMKALLALALLVAVSARAHDVPIPPSACTFDVLELTVPELGLTAEVAPAIDDDAMRVVYEVATRTMQFTAPATRARPFTLDGHAGTLGFPQAFQADLLASGDVTFRLVGLAVTLAGETRLAPVTLTTVVLDADGIEALGAPIGADGRLTLVGTIAPGLLPAPFDAVAAVVRASCALTPAPDTDQFVPVFAPKTLRLGMGARGRLRAVLRGAAPEPDAHPLHVRVAAGDVVLVTLALPSGLQRERGTRFVGQTADGSVVRLRTKPRGIPTHRLDVELADAALPAGLAASGTVDVLYDVGGIVARDLGTYRVRGTTLRAK